MTLSPSQVLSVEFDEKSFAQACDLIRDIITEKGPKGEELLDSIFAALLMRKIERESPGVISAAATFKKSETSASVHTV